MGKSLLQGYIFASIIIILALFASPHERVEALGLGEFDAADFMGLAFYGLLWVIVQNIFEGVFSAVRLGDSWLRTRTDALVSEMKALTFPPQQQPDYYSEPINLIELAQRVAELNKDVIHGGTSDEAIRGLERIRDSADLIDRLSVLSKHLKSQRMAKDTSENIDIFVNLWKNLSLYLKCVRGLYYVLGVLVTLLMFGAAFVWSLENGLDVGKIFFMKLIESLRLIHF